MSKYLLHSVITMCQNIIDSEYEAESMLDGAKMSARRELAEEILALATTPKPIYSVPQGPDSGVNAIFGMCPDLPVLTTEKAEGDDDKS